VDYEESTFTWQVHDGPAVDLDSSALTRVRFDLDDGVAVVTLDRPEQRNAIDGQTLVELTRVLHHCDRSDDVRVVVLTGAGPVFCVGSELSGDGFGGEAADDPDELPWLAPFQLRKPVLAALNGHTVGAGLTLAMQCDVRLAATGAILSFPFVRLGVIGEWMGHWTAVRHLGVARTAELFFTARRFSGADAEAWGLVSRALPANQVLPATVALAREMADHAAPVSLALTKRLIWEAATADQRSAGRTERLLLEGLLETADAREGVAAYLAKRRPAWSGSVGSDLPGWPGAVSR
jgi:enoyl-CoA hydratase/carnithine racemase